MNLRLLKSFYINKIKSLKERFSLLFIELNEFGYLFSLRLFFSLLSSEFKFRKAKRLSADYQEYMFSKDMINETKYPTYYENEYTFEHMDSFSLNAFNWDLFFFEFKLENSNLNYLEIGSFEGRSSVFVLERLKKAYCYFVDPFKSYDEMTKSTNQEDFNSIYNNFKKNTENFKGRFETHKKTSSDFFCSIGKSTTFNLIYIDGSHFYDDVYADAQNADKHLAKNGFIIFDDFIWFWYKNLRDNPFFAITRFLFENKEKYKIIYLGNQLILKRKY